MWTKYISKEHYGNIRNFKYSGSCNSILYKYVLSDWAQFLVFLSSQIRSTGCRDGSHRT